MSDKTKFTPPFIKVPTVIQDSTQLTEGHVSLYVALKAHQNAKTGQCNPSEETIAKDLGVSTATVRRRKKLLIEKGVLNIERGYQSSVNYTFPLETGKPGQVLTLMRDLKRKQGKSLLGDFVEKAEVSFRSPMSGINKDRGFIPLTRAHSYRSPMSDKQEERTTHGGAAPFKGEAATAVGESSQERKKEKPSEKEERKPVDEATRVKLLREQVARMRKESEHP
jgi:DNA-binding transcriptional regulator YhcF (GntR family)